MSNINTKLNELANNKINIERSITSVNAKKTQVQAGLTVVSPDTKIDGEIKELQFEKQLVTLRKESRAVDYNYQLELRKINQEEYNKNITELEKQTTDELNVINSKIETLQKQKDNNDPYSHIKNKQKKLSALKSKKLSSLRSKRTKASGSIGKFIFKTATTAIAAALSTIVYKQMTSANSKLGGLESMVERVNDLIENIQTVSDIQKATIERNNAVNLLTTVESSLLHLKKVIDTIAKVVKVMLVVVKVLKRVISVVPGPLKSPFKITLQKIEAILGAIQVVLSSASGVLENLIETVQELRDRLEQIGNIIENVSQNPDLLSSGDIDSLLSSSNYGKLGILDTTYKGFRFAVKEEFNTNFVVQGHKRRYAEAINRDNTSVLKSEASFTLDPDILIQELILIIDRDNLTT